MVVRDGSFHRDSDCMTADREVRDISFHRDSDCMTAGRKVPGAIDGQSEMFPFLYFKSF